jgi:tRNA (guanine37-N1)-methyltransferase
MTWRATVLTIFPEMLPGPLAYSLAGKALNAGIWRLETVDIRDFARDKHRSVDDAPFGGGPGMVMKPEPWYAALQQVCDSAEGTGARPRVVVPTPSGRLLTQALVEELAREPWLAIPCGRYEGIDRRVIDRWADDEVSLGDYVLAGGEVAALVIVEAVTRLLPGVVGNAESVADDSHTTGLLEGPVYTRPASYDGRDVPPVLLSGDHGAIARWRRDEALRRTALLRPELLARVPLSGRDRALLAELDLPFPLPPPAVAD